jgi:uncharacterized lipoprotein YmbA
MRKLALSFLILGMLAGCGYSPEPDDYILTSTEGTPKNLTTQIKIERPVLPEYLDRPQIVELKDNDQIYYNEMQRWAAPLDIMIENILAEDLRQRIPASTLTTEQESEARNARFIIQPTIDIFNSADGMQTLKAQINIDDHLGCKLTSHASLVFASTAHGQREEGLSKLTGALSDFIIEDLETRSLNQPCP